MQQRLPENRVAIRNKAGTPQFFYEKTATFTEDFNKVKNLKGGYCSKKKQIKNYGKTFKKRKKRKNITLKRK